MQKRVYIIHGWDGYPEEGWFPWLKKELEQKGFEVVVPSMPNPAAPEISAWLGYLSKLVGQPDDQTFLIGHSMGCQTILRYLASLKDQQIGGVVLVAGFFALRPLETEEEENIFKPWIETPVDFGRIKQATTNITAIFSDDDPWVPLQKNIKLFKENLGEKITIIAEHNKQHFHGSSGIKELPSALAAVLSYAQ